MTGEEDVQVGDAQEDAEITAALAKPVAISDVRRAARKVSFRKPRRISTHRSRMRSQSRFFRAADTIDEDAFPYETEWLRSSRVRSVPNLRCSTPKSIEAKIDLGLPVMYLLPACDIVTYIETRRMNHHWQLSPLCIIDE